MSNLTPPPISGIIVNPGSKGVFTQPWTSWLINLFTAIGGQSGAGSSYLSVNLPDVTQTTPCFTGIPRGMVIVAISATLQASLTPSVVLTVSNVTQSVTIGTLTLPATSSAGKFVSLRLQTPNIIHANDVIKIVSNNSSIAGVSCLITLTLQYVG